MTIYFLYLLVLTTEKNRISDETAKMGAFLCAILTLIAYLNQKSKYDRYSNLRGNRGYMRDNYYDNGYYYKDNLRHREDKNLLTL